MKQIWLFAMRRLSASVWALLCVLTLAAGASVAAQEPKPEPKPEPQQEPAPAAQPAAPVKVMRDYKGVKLDMTKEQVRAIMGKTELEEDDRDRFIIKGEDRLTVIYEKGKAKALRLYIVDPKNAPMWADVVGDMQITQMDNGAKHARRELRDENFWVSMYQSKDGAITTITISR